MRRSRFGRPTKTVSYDLQTQDGAEVPAMDMRGQFRTDANGNYYMRTVLPLGYLIPMDGPVSDMIRAQKRHGYRPSHIHFLVGAPGYRELVTALYPQGDVNIDADTVFGVTDSLVVQVEQERSEFADGGISERPLRIQAGARGERRHRSRGRGPVADHEASRPNEQPLAPVPCRL